MLREFSQLMLGISLAIAILLFNPAWVWASPNPTELAKAVEEIEHLDQLRSGLAGTLEGKAEAPTLETMKEVCKPVGMKAMQLSQENHWQVKQIAKKYRNPAHIPDNEQSENALKQFAQNPDLIGFWQQETVENQPGTRYYRRINVEASCLACHGLKNQRPEFVENNYPQDLAYDFKVGDLRGMYAVFIPDLQAALQK